MTDQELAEEIAGWKLDYNPETGKPYGLRSIADMLGVTYGKARYIEAKYLSSDSEDEAEFLGEPSLSFSPVRSYVWDLETTNLNTFMGQLTVASFLDLADGAIYTKTLFDFEGDGAEKEVALLLWTVSMLEEADILIGHNTIGFDTGFLRGRLAIHGLSDVTLPRRQHWDTYQIARHGFKGRPQGYSLENLLDFFRIPVQKDKPSKHDWAASIILDEKAIKRIAKRCEADCVGNALLWEALRPYFHLWRGR